MSGTSYELIGWPSLRTARSQATARAVSLATPYQLGAERARGYSQPPCLTSRQRCTLVAEQHIIIFGLKLASGACIYPQNAGSTRATSSGSGEWELLMPQPIARRVALRAMQLAIVAAGIFVIMMLFSRQAHASTLDTQSPLGSAPSSALSSVGSAVNAVAKPVTSATSAVNAGQQGGSHSGSSGAGNQSSGGSGSSATSPQSTASVVPVAGHATAPVTNTVAPVIKSAAQAISPVASTSTPVAKQT